MAMEGWDRVQDAHGKASAVGPHGLGRALTPRGKAPLGSLK